MASGNGCWLVSNDAIVAAIFYMLTTTIWCQDISDGLTTMSRLTEATTSNFDENAYDLERFFQGTAINPETKFPNGSYCRQAYTCHSVSALEASPVVLGCSCDDHCAIYGDCCSDKVSVLPPLMPERLPRASYSCAPAYLFQHSVYMITACPASFEDQSIAGNCSNFNNDNDNDFNAPSMDLRSTPVTDVVTGTTFRNVYCAICWGKARRSIATWLWKLTCREAYHESNKLETDSNSTSTDSASGSGISGESSATDYIRSSCSLTFEPPVLNASLHFCNEYVIADCGLASSIADLDPTLLSACQNGPAAYVYNELGSAYWNAECAQCRFWPAKPTLSCQSPKVSGAWGVPSLSLSIILTPESGNCAATAGSLSSKDGWTPDSLCRGLLGCQSDGSGWEPACQSKLFSLRGGPQAAPSGSATGRFSPALVSESLSICTFIDSRPSADTVAKARSTAWLNASADGRAVLAVTLIDNTTLCYFCATGRYENYTTVNRSLVVNSPTGVLRRSFDYPMYAVEEGVATVCTAVLPLPKGSTTSVEDGCSAVPAFVSALFLCLSEVAIIVFVAAFARVKALRRFPGEMVLNESVAFFLAFLFFLVRPLLDTAPAACTAIAVLIHYFLLAAFAWTALYSTEIARALSFRVSEGVSKRRRALHYSLAWGAPLVCVAVGLGADVRALEFRPHYGPPQCFIGSRLGNLTLFMAPLCIFLTIDIIVYVYMIVKLAIIARQTSSVRSSHHEKLWLSVKLVLSMGLLWLFAVLASFTQSAALYCVFSLVNALQGVFVFGVFVCKRDVMVALGRKSKASTTTTTAASALLSSRTRSTTSNVSS